MTMKITPVILVTGAAGGIGNEIVTHLIGELECRAIATDIVEGDLLTLRETSGGNLEVVTGDISQVRYDNSITDSASHCKLKS